MRTDALLAFVVGLPLVVLSTVVAALSVPGFRAVALIAAALVAHVALAFRRTRPVVSHGVICAALACQLAVTGLFLVMPSALVFPLSLFACTAYGPRWLGLITGATGAALVTVRFQYDGSVRAAELGPNPWMLLALLLAVVVAAWSKGLFRRTQLAYTRLLEDRAEEAAARAVQDERTRIAREMHDVVAHSLSVMVNQARGGQHAPDRAGETLAVIEDTGRRAMTDMRGLLGVLRTGPAEQLAQPTLAELPELLDRVRAAGLPVQLVEDGEPVALGAVAELTAYRIIQEALTNTVKHAGTATAVVTLSWRPAILVVSIVDDGNGPVGDDHGNGQCNCQDNGQGNGQGLFGMRERVTAIGGTVVTGPGPAGGFQVEARIPVGDRP